MVILKSSFEKKGWLFQEKLGQSQGEFYILASGHWSHGLPQKAATGICRLVSRAEFSNSKLILNTEDLMEQVLADQSQSRD